MKKAYTLLEILIVVIIIALMIWVFGFFMPDRDEKQIKFGKESSNYIYSTIIDWLNTIKKNKSTTYNWKSEYLDQILIIFHPQQSARDNKIEITYSLENWNKFSNIPLKDWGIINNTEINNSDKYRIQMLTWYRISINNNWELSIPENDYEDMVLNSCIDIWDENTCIPISKIIFNQAAQTIQQKFCLDFSWSVCNEWEQ